MKNKKSKKVFGYPERPRISVFRSNKEIYAQIIDDLSGKTLVTSSSIEKEFQKYKKKNKTELANEVGKLLGNRAKKLKIKKLVFDKGKYLYHGRIKSLANGIREVGLEF
ncbi:50S ribosomal protein L18 [Blattabacterium sp. (Blaberus giganteus)]|uniref:50S ribosomal protein L18 n=1 Tax=Blattabacterium sp. (Blaberus giganteus) TaxID=1186051 RepID=UPI00025F6F7D|nr:50S ribosomal protein L18 [Blattabacterium sp. (Blaberus giganteus)]AFJ90812.1 50S ribosomal protein L18 [Blattabacterium sp. (Blaberus giganteus)]